MFAFALQAGSYRKWSGKQRADPIHTISGKSSGVCIKYIIQIRRLC